MATEIDRSMPSAEGGQAGERALRQAQDGRKMGFPPFEGMLRKFFGPRGADLDAMSVAFLLFRTDTLTLSAMESEALRPNGLTHAGFVLLMTLWMMGPQETRQLAWIQRVSKPSIVSAVDTLERAGLVRRSRSESDKRLVTVELTDEGQQTIELAWEAWHACERKFAGVLSRDEQRTLASMLRRIDEAACELGDRLQGTGDRRQVRD